MHPRQLRMLKSKYMAGDKKSRHAMEEFGPARREFIFCPHGEAVYYKKSWHHTSKFFRNPPDFKKEKSIRFRECPAHEMLKNKQYEGEIIVKNVPASVRADLVRLVENMGERAMRKDVLDCVLGLEVRTKELRVTTSENQLAQRIAGKITATFAKHARAKISRAKEDDVVRVVVDFL